MIIVDLLKRIPKWAWIALVINELVSGLLLLTHYLIWKDFCTS